jgi:hypothetical protein
MRERDPGSKRKIQIEKGSCRDGKKNGSFQALPAAWKRLSATLQITNGFFIQIQEEACCYSSSREVRSVHLQTSDRSQLLNSRSSPSTSLALQGTLSLFSLSLRSLRLPPSSSFPGPKSVRGVFHISSPRIQHRRHNPASYFVTSFLPRQ